MTRCKVRYKQNVHHILDAGKSILISYSIPILHLSTSSCQNIHVSYTVFFFLLWRKIDREKKTYFSKSYVKKIFRIYIYCERARKNIWINFAAYLNKNATVTGQKNYFFSGFYVLSIFWNIIENIYVQWTNLFHWIYRFWKKLLVFKNVVAHFDHVFSFNDYSCLSMDTGSEYLPPPPLQNNKSIARRLLYFTDFSAPRNYENSSAFLFWKERH